MADKDIKSLGNAELPDSADGTAAGYPATSIAADPLIYPCSVAQERFWLLDRIDPGNAALNVAVRWRLKGVVETALLERAWLNIINRHEVLRTVFREVDGKPVQEILPRSSFKLAEIDLSALPEAERDAEGDRIGVIEARAPFDLTEGPILRATLVRYTADDAALLVTTHQIVADGWSVGVMARELGLIYQALATASPIPLDDLPLQYADYTEWQQAFTRERGTAAEDAYWSRQLAGLKPFKVPADKPRSPVQSSNGGVAAIWLPPEITRRAQATSGEFGATLFTAALAALTTTLHRYTAETEIVIGMLVSDRDQVELEGLIGQFVNALILRNDLSGDPSFGQLIERLRDTNAAALEHKRIPIERLLSMAGSSRRDGQSALISVNFIFQRSFIEDADYGAFTLADMAPLPSDTMYDLNFFMVELPEGWQLACQYSSDQYEQDTVERLLRYMQTILDVACRNPQQPLSAIPMIGADERLRLQGDGPDRQAFPSLRGLHTRFTTQAQQNPEAVAMVGEPLSLSYAQIEAQAGRLAGHLLERGVTAGTRIGLCLPRGADWSIAMLALMRIGASWIAIDPKESRSRIGMTVEVARVAHVITRAAQAALLPVERLTVIDLDADASLIGRATVPVAVAPIHDSEACAFTYATPQGRPAVYRISHAALETRLMALATQPGLAAGDTVIAAAAYALDVSLIELLLPLLVGARMVLATDADCDDPTRLALRLNQQRNPLLLATPKRIGQLIAAGWSSGSKLRVWVHGERLGVVLARRLITRSSEVWTLYTVPGAAICSALHRLDKAEDTMVLGRSTPGTQLRVLGPTRQLLPIGAVGELHIGGVSLPLGLATASSLADRLVAAPDVEVAGSRMLRTRDLARMRNDGLIEFIGRSDRALRIDGHWVEPAEIEAQLARHPNVSEAAVDAAPENADGSGDLALTAWIVLAGASTGPVDGVSETLRGAFANRLPAPLLPARFLVVDSLPRTAQREIDFRRLRRPGVAGNARAVGSSEVENRIVRIWTELLERTGIEREDNFFELGGHSLLAARMLRRVETEFGRRIGLAALFRAPTVRDLAQLLGSDDARDFDFRQVVKLQPNGSRPPMIAINNTGIYYSLAKRLGQDQPVTSLQLFDPAVGLDTMPKTIEEIASQYVKLIQRVQPRGPYLLMGWCVAGALAFEVARQLQSSGQTVDNLYLMDAWVPNYLERLSPLRRLVNARTLRLQYVVEDFRQKLGAGKSLREFIVNRMFYKRLLRLIRGGGGGEPLALGREASARAEPAGYDMWLLDYLQDLSARYEPKPYDGRITLFRSRREPTGYWFDPLAGWGAFALQGVRLHMVDGDHFSMFQEPGASQMAALIADQE